jgi:hypothetical protein
MSSQQRYLASINRIWLQCHPRVIIRRIRRDRHLTEILNFRRSLALIFSRNSVHITITMSARQALNTIARRRLVPPKPQKTYVKWYMNWADTAHKAVVLTCVGVTCTKTIRGQANEFSVLWRWGSLYVLPESQE